MPFSLHCLACDINIYQNVDAVLLMPAAVFRPRLLRLCWDSRWQAKETLMEQQMQQQQQQRRGRRSRDRSSRQQQQQQLAKQQSRSKVAAAR
jgi:hypothetical protein